MNQPEEPNEDRDFESGYADGKRMALRGVIQDAMKSLGYDDPLASASSWIIERESIVAQLRDVCRDYGDNDWEPDLHLGDVIEKHLRRHLDENSE